jgi:hypothetical protein
MPLTRDKVDDTAVVSAYRTEAANQLSKQCAFFVQDAPKPGDTLKRLPTHYAISRRSSGRLDLRSVLEPCAQFFRAGEQRISLPGSPT